MKLLPTLLACVSLLLPLAPAAPLALQPEVPCPADLRPLIRYEPLPAEETEEMRAYCELCHTIIFCEDTLSENARTFTIPHGERLCALLKQIAAQTQWYERCCDDSDIEPSPTPAIRMLDEDGDIFCELEFFPADSAVCIREGNEYISLWELCRRFLATTTLEDNPVQNAPPPPGKPATRVLSARVATSLLEDDKVYTIADPEHQALELAACFEGINPSELKTNTEEGVFGMPTTLLLLTDGSPHILIINNVPGVFSLNRAQETSPGRYEVPDEGLGSSVDVFMPELYEKLKAAGTPLITLEELTQLPHIPHVTLTWELEGGYHLVLHDIGSGQHIWHTLVYRRDAEGKEQLLETPQFATNDWLKDISLRDNKLIITDEQGNITSVPLFHLSTRKP